MKNKGKKPSKSGDAGKQGGKVGEIAGMAAWKAHAWEYGKTLVFAVLLALVIRTFVVQAFHIPSGSMIPTFLEGDRVLVSKFAYGLRNPFTNEVIFGRGRPERGDVVIFKFPENPKVDFVKRVVGLPGDRLQVADGRVLINGVPIPDPHGHYDNPYPLGSRNFGPVTVPDNQYFMMGDNRDFSNDSRSWGFVDASLLRGKAWRLYFSWDSTSGLPLTKRLRLDRLGLKIR
jgi:signal peptidase I